MFKDEILEAFISGFYGYGNYGARLWFIGMEEGGGGSREQIARRLDAWDKRGRNELEDVVDYHRVLSRGRSDDRVAVGNDKVGSFSRC